ncbi:hypothetical protein DK926_15025 [Rhodococcus sp. Eu-32]|nr:hypothetical protein DK926_15025 [Rhodococcus sp. Eu-32]
MGPRDNASGSGACDQACGPLGPGRGADGRPSRRMIWVPSGDGPSGLRGGGMRPGGGFLGGGGR